MPTTRPPANQPAAKAAAPSSVRRLRRAERREQIGVGSVGETNFYNFIHRTYFKRKTEAYKSDEVINAEPT